MHVAGIRFLLDSTALEKKILGQSSLGNAT